GGLDGVWELCADVTLPGLRSGNSCDRQRGADRRSEELGRAGLEEAADEGEDGQAVEGLQAGAEPLRDVLTRAEEQRLRSRLREPELRSDLVVREASPLS